MTQTPRQVLAEVAAAGYCGHPVQLHGTTVDVETGELSHTLLRVPCKDRRAAVCPACSYLYKADAWILIAAGMLGGKGLSAEVESHPRVFVTLTAPSFGAVHRVTTSGRCHPSSRPATCRHGVTTTCRTSHADDDSLLGAPLCVDCFDYEAAVLWNATASKLWHRTMVRLRQGVGATQHLGEAELHKIARINYLKVAEFQRRGLVHFHAVIRADGPDGAESPPPEWLTTEVLEHQVRRLALTVVFKGIERLGFQWGSQLEISDVTAGEDDGRRIAGYLAKYAVKSTDDSATFARRFRRRHDIERMPARDHARQLALTAWDLGEDPALEALGLRRHAHAFGFTGQLITKSQGFSAPSPTPAAATPTRGARRSPSSSTPRPWRCASGPRNDASKTSKSSGAPGTTPGMVPELVPMVPGVVPKRATTKRRIPSDCTGGNESMDDSGNSRVSPVRHDHTHRRTAPAHPRAGPALERPGGTTSPPALRRPRDRHRVSDLDRRAGGVLPRPRSGPGT